MSSDVLAVQVEWQEGKRIEATARGNRLVVDQIYADGRESGGFRPTELILSGIGACMMGTVLGFCENMKIPVEKFSISVEGVRGTKPERISEIRLRLELRGNIPEDRRETLLRVAQGCRVHYTLTHAPEIHVDLRLSGSAVSAGN
ncbi:MAG: OsmC family protein [bacterium]|nr:OsmC family protein [bacterium]